MEETMKMTKQEETKTFQAKVKTKVKKLYNNQYEVSDVVGNYYITTKEELITIVNKIEEIERTELDNSILKLDY